ncbi:D-alanyl-D-alanine carboxypeptidase [Luteolibacter yonseiensis]|uniref:D-alanyl-D-alanine carboxypeptidase n=1 Tax=Luteolibacter yonseiensis TaxID=1144680 RepID=A0A934R6V9_9BACT|nr:serine hydrolase [Luteolibacter yonseiensis]MBK1817063.1 D-alanyl-D-alanine carboxypeptidase [Luteolibacter yonseiensis]
MTILKTLAFLAALLPLCLSAQAPESIMVVEAYSGKVLIASNAGLKRPIASITKVATACVAVDWATATGTDLGTTITVPQTITLVGGPNPMNLQPGDQMSLRDALYSALLGSDNLAAVTIANHVGGEIASRRGSNADPVGIFVGEMNQLTKAVGATATRFANPHGLERQGTKAYSTAADVARLSIYAMRRPAITFITSKQDRQISVTSGGAKRSFTLKNTNELAGETGILGVKTGTTAAAGPCLSVCMDRDPLVRQKPDGSKGATPRRLVVVVLNNPDRFSRARNLLRQGWGIYDQWLSAGAPVQNKEREILHVPMPK